MPTESARHRVEGSAANHGGRAIGLRVWSWDELWTEVGRRHPDGPGKLSEAAARAVLMLAIRGALGANRLSAPSELAETAGYRRTLAARIAAWTTLGRDPESAPPPDADSDGWEVFGRYRRMLAQLKAQDRAGHAVWASRRLGDVLDDLPGRGSDVVIDMPTTGGRPVRLALKTLATRADALVLTLPWEDDPGRREVYHDVEPLRRCLLDWGLEERRIDPPRDRPASLAALGRDLFREGPAAPLNQPGGLSLRGAPRGEGVALAVAREVRDRLDAGAGPDDFLVVFPRWDTSAEVVLETLRAWGLPACGGPGRPPVADASVAALLAALGVSIDEFETSSLMHLLRHGRVRPRWPEASGPGALTSAASAIRDVRIFRGRAAIRNALRGAGNVDPDEKDRRKIRRAQRARDALPLFDRLAELLDALDRPVSWRAQVAKARAIASELNLAEPDGSEALDGFLDALDDEGAVLDGLKLGRRSWRWESFVREVGSIAREVVLEPGPPKSGHIRLVTVAECEGVTARHVILAGLEEGTFPDREAIDLDPAAPDTEADDEDTIRPAERAFARELRRFLSVIDSARATLSLIYPTADEKGQALLPAGFVEDVRRMIDEESLERCQSESKRLDPVLPPNLAIALAEVRVLAVAEAIVGDPSRLAKMAADPAHRLVLDGVAAALRVARARRINRGFGPFDGGLADPEAARRIADDFGPDRPAFSASQLETLAYCPFKFFLRHVLKLEPTDDREELEEDSTRRGHLIHAALEQLHKRLRDAPPEDGPPLPRSVRDGIVAEIEQQLSFEPDPASDVDAGLRVIDAERLRRTGRRYADQFEDYFGRLDGVACHGFEVVFGKDEDGPPSLVLGEGEARVGLQGFIDRIDVVRIEGRLYFRIIDYKTGACPTSGELRAGLALQLPLYAMAVQRLILHEAGAEPLDMAYWELKGSGFKPILATQKLPRSRLTPVSDWAGFLARMEAYVVALVDRLRHADFPVAPRADDCTRSCEYRHVCRIAQLRNLNKRWPGQPNLEHGS